jgi:hypothetical protein
VFKDGHRRGPIRLTHFSDQHIWAVSPRHASGQWLGKQLDESKSAAQPAVAARWADNKSVPAATDDTRALEY